MLEWKMPLKQEVYDFSYLIEDFGGNGKFGLFLVLVVRRSTLMKS